MALIRILGLWLERLVFSPAPLGKRNQQPSQDAPKQNDSKREASAAPQDTASFEQATVFAAGKE